MPRVTSNTWPAGASDHGALAGLADDDHSQYHNDTRGDARYALIADGVTNGEWLGLATSAEIIALDAQQPMSGQVYRYTYSDAAIRFRFIDTGTDEFYTGWDGTTLTSLVANRFVGV